MRRGARRDENEKEIIEFLRKCGCSVSQINSEDGFPDLVVGRNGYNYLLEVKDGSKKPSLRKLTKEQEEWHAIWRGQKAIVENIEQATKACGIKVN